MKGRGVNSIPVRFALLSAMLAGFCSVALVLAAHSYLSAHASYALMALVVGASVVVQATVTYVAAEKLTSSIRALHRSTELIASGDSDSPIEVDCACEVGGLADSFRGMVERLNSNIIRINVLAYTDGVTGLPNRVALQHTLTNALADTDGEPFEGSLLFMDLDGFKRVNDTLGHEAGDELLRQAAARIVEMGFGRKVEDLDHRATAFGEPSTLPPEDLVVARFAGDEFVALAPGVTDHEELEQISARILAAMSLPFEIMNSKVTIGASIGVARMPQDSRVASEILNFADVAMYAAKRSGKGRTRFFDHELHRITLEQAEIESELGLALEQHQFVLHYQPKIDCRTLEIRGVEALVRWNHPKRGLIGPDQFIDIAERSGNLPQLGAWVLEQALRQCRIWLDAGWRVPVAVNMSPTEFDNPGLAEDIRASLLRVGLPAELLELEITESVAMCETPECLKRMDELSALGVQLSIDDFGVGYSNLSRISRLPVTKVKIDRSLVSDCDMRRGAVEILTAVVEMAHALGLETVAEGVENFGEFRILSEIGCDDLQGFLFSKPIDVANFAALLTETQGVLAVEGRSAEVA